MEGRSAGSECESVAPVRHPPQAPPFSALADPYGRRELPKPLRPMESAPRELCGEASAKRGRIPQPLERWHPLEVGPRGGWRAWYPRVSCAATEVVPQGFRRE